MNPTHAAEVQVACDHLARQVDQVAVELWRGLVDSLDRRDPWQLFLHQLHVVSHQLPGLLHRYLVIGITQLVRQVHVRTVDQFRELLATRHVLEAESKQFAILYRDWSTTGQLFQPLDEQSLLNLLTDLLPPQDWDHDDLYSARGARTSATELVRMVSLMVQQGKSPQQIALALRPYFDGSRVRAMRAARTFGHYVAGQVQLVAGEQLGSTIVGYTVYHLPRETARVDHTRRNGTSYYRHPQSGQLGFDVMPHPPVDRGGPNEDQRGIRWNCSCYLVPILSPILSYHSSNPATNSLASQLRWWTNASEQERKAFAGVRRYNEVSALLGHPPYLEELLGPNGQLLPLAELRNESHTERAQRVLEVRKNAHVR